MTDSMAALGELDGDAALLDDLLILLGGDDNEDDPTPREDLSATRPRARARRPTPVNPHKRQVECLEREIAALRDQLTKLRGRATHAQELAQEARWKRRRAEAECEQLRAAVAAQTRFVRGLGAVFAPSPLLRQGLCGYRLLHKPTLLPRDRGIRRQEYAILADQARLHGVVDLLCRETEALSLADRDEPLVPSLEDPYITTELTSDRAGFHVTATFVYAVPTRDLAAAARGVWVAFRDSSIKCCAFSSTSCASHIVDADATTSLPVDVHYRVEGIQYKNLHEAGAQIVGGTRSVTFSRVTNDSAITLWDYVDEDELHPLQATAQVTRKAVGACFIRLELCDDGVERASLRNNVLLVGDRGVGKSTLMRRIIYDWGWIQTPSSREARYLLDTNWGAFDFSIVEIDTSSSLHDPHDYMQAHSAIVMFDTNSRSSFKNALSWYDTIARVCDNIPIVLCGNVRNGEHGGASAKTITFDRNVTLPYFEFGVGEREYDELRELFLWLARRIASIDNADDDIYFVEVSRDPAFGWHAEITAEQIAQIEAETAAAAFAVPLPDEDDDL